MREIVRLSQFKRDVKLAEKRNKNLKKLREAILMLAEEKVLPERLRDHPLSGRWRNHRDLHIEPDWLLIYRIEGNDLHLVRTGSHSDLFK